MTATAEQMGAALVALPRLVEEVEELRHRVRALERRLSESEVTQSGPYDGLLVLDTKQAGALVGKHPDTVRKAAQTGELHGAQRTAPKGRWSFRRDCLDAWLGGVACPHSEGGR